jgi:hypothetical protein
MLFFIGIGIAVFCIVFVVIAVIRTSKKDRRARENFYHMKEKGEAFLADAVNRKKYEEISFEETRIYHRSTRDEPFTLHEVEPRNNTETEEMEIASSDEEYTASESEGKPRMRRRRSN